LIAKRAPLLVILLGLSGCATLDDLWSSNGEDDGSDFVPLEDRPVEEPLDPNTFTLNAAGQSVVGEPEIVFATETDTLSDLARTYGLGYDEIIAANPDAQRIAWENLREQINRALDHSADLGKKQALEKLASFIFECQYRQAGNKAPGKTVKIPIRRCDMAEYLGLQPETVSRGFRELQDRKIINFRNSSDIEITRLPSLKRIANGGQAGDATVRQNGAGMKVLSFS